MTNMLVCPVKIKLEPGGKMPSYGSQEAAGMDLYAYVDGVDGIAPGRSKLIQCGFSMEMPRGYEAQIRPRSGLAFKHGITVLNSPGTIDSDYRGTVGVILINHGDVNFNVTRGDRIAQMVIQRIPGVDLIAVDMLDDTERGEGGFGSTGTN
jgi:dUTP pyrophosphatase